jgi:uncharacterized protein with HEPN domain
MSKRDAKTALRSMLDHATEAVSLVRDKARADLDSERMLNLALMRLLEIVGEAANRVPREEREQYPNIPWQEIVSLRNRLIHGYDSVDFDILWTIVTNDLPLLIAALKGILTPVDNK